MTDQAIIAAALHGYVSGDALAALDRLVAERDALRARVDEAVADEPRDADLLAAALARAEAAEKEARSLVAERDRATAAMEAAEKERDEAQEALQNLAADHYFARAEAAEARIVILERQVQNLGALAIERRARCATLEAQQGTLVALVRIGFLVTVNGERGRTDVVKDPGHRETLIKILQAENISAACAALAAATPPAEEEVVAAASVLGLSREETDELVRLARSEGIRTQPVEKEETP